MGTTNIYVHKTGRTPDETVKEFAMITNGKILAWVDQGDYVIIRIEHPEPIIEREEGEADENNTDSD